MNNHRMCSRRTLNQLCGAAMVAVLATPALGQSVGTSSGEVSGAALPATVTLNGTVRDFKAYDQTGGHPDFQRWTGDTRVGLLESQLDQEGKPVLLSLNGAQITTEFRNAAGDPINPALFNASLGDTPGMLQQSGEPRLTSAASFAQWYRDAAGVNVSVSIPLTLTRVPNTERYVFDSAVDEPYATRGGFFPVDGAAYGNYAATGHNFHFTTEFESLFQYNHGAGQVFRFAGDDDVWVFVDNRLVIDLGGVHSARTQVIDLDRLTWLVDGHDYTLKIFHAERRTTQSNFRIDTTLHLRSVQVPATSALAD